MKIISIEIYNILSIEKASLSFDESGLLLVDGWNHDIGRANGAGKTALFNGISFALFDKVPRKITATEILKREATSGYARCTIISGQDTWEITRRRPKGVEFTKNGVKADITQKEFEASIRLTYDQFLLTMYTAQSTNGGTDRFLMKSDTDKKTFLLRLLDLEKFSACKKNADGKINVLNADIKTLQSKIENNLSRISAYTESLVDEDALNQSLKIMQSSLGPVNKELSQLATVLKPDISNFAKLENDIRQKQQEIAQARTKREMLHAQYKKLEQTLRSSGTEICQECGTALDTPESRERHAANHARASGELVSIRDAIGRCDDLIASSVQMDSLLKRLIEKRAKRTEEYDKASKRIDELNSFIKGKETQIEVTKAKIIANTDLLSKIAKLQETNSEQEAKIVLKKADLQIWEVVSTIYSPTGAQAYILDSVVDLFNETIGEYVNIVWPNASYTIESQKENSKGEMVAKFSETLMMGKSEVSVGSLSGGEFKAFSLCVDFTLLSILSKQFGIDLNPIILDEPFDGLDSVGKKIVINLLAKLAKDKQIVVVDHASEAKSLFPKVVMVEKRNDTSTISIEA